MKNRFSRWQSWWPSRFSDWNDFSYFLSINKSPRCFLPSFKSSGLLVQDKKRKVDFQDGDHCGHLGSPIIMILALLDLQVTPMFLPSFKLTDLSIKDKNKK